MRLNALYLFSLFIISTTSKSILDDFSIDGFMKQLIENGLFEIILSIKYHYGIDVAIISCEEINENHNSNCKTLVLNYMSTESPESPLSPESSDESSESSESSVSSVSSLSSVSSDSPKSSGSYGQTPKPPEEPLNYWDIMKNSNNMPFLLYTLKKKFNLEKSKSLYHKIVKRIEKQGHNL